MKIVTALSNLLITGSIGTAVMWSVLPVPRVAAVPLTDRPVHWNGAAAAGALDARETWWQQWPHARKDQGTLCVSCHTVLPYAMARPQLQHQLGETAMPSQETVMLASVEKRVALWSAVVPFYSDAHDGKGKTAESHATEAVLNAVILLSIDTQNGQLRPITRTALDELWALQQQSGENAGSWLWQDFHLAPWESTESAYQATALLLQKLSQAPGNYVQEAEPRVHVAKQEDYLRRHYAKQPLLNQLYVLWASSQAPQLLRPDERRALVQRMESLQQPDGGWRTAAFATIDRSDHSADPLTSDGYATGLAVLALEASGERTPALQNGVKWLEDHQHEDGTWDAASMNKQRDPNSAAAKFMSDAATGYAVMALLQARRGR